MMSRVLVREGENTRTSGTFNQEVVQANLLFGLKIWATTPQNGQTLGGFHHWVARCLAGMKPQERYKCVVVVPAFVRRDGGSSHGGGGYVHPPPTHHHCSVHCDLSNSGAVSGGVAADVRAVIMEMVGSGGFRLGGNEVGGEVNKGGSGGEGIIRGRGREAEGIGEVEMRNDVGE